MWQHRYSTNQRASLPPDRYIHGLGAVNPQHLCYPQPGLSHHALPQLPRLLAPSTSYPSARMGGYRHPPGPHHAVGRHPGPSLDSLQNPYLPYPGLLANSHLNPYTAPGYHPMQHNHHGNTGPPTAPYTAPRTSSMVSMATQPLSGSFSNSHLPEMPVLKPSINKTNSYAGYGNLSTRCSNDEDSVVQDCAINAAVGSGMKLKLEVVRNPKNTSLQEEAGGGEGQEQTVDFFQCRHCSYHSHCQKQIQHHIAAQHGTPVASQHGAPAVSPHTGQGQTSTLNRHQASKTNTRVKAHNGYPGNGQKSWSSNASKHALHQPNQFTIQPPPIEITPQTNQFTIQPPPIKITPQTNQFTIQPPPIEITPQTNQFTVQPLPIEITPQTNQFTVQPPPIEITPQTNQFTVQPKPPPINITPQPNQFTIQPQPIDITPHTADRRYPRHQMYTPDGTAYSAEPSLQGRVPMESSSSAPVSMVESPHHATADRNYPRHTTEGRPMPTLTRHTPQGTAYSSEPGLQGRVAMETSSAAPVSMVDSTLLNYSFLAAAKLVATGAHTCPPYSSEPSLQGRVPMESSSEEPVSMAESRHHATGVPVYPPVKLEPNYGNYGNVLQGSQWSPGNVITIAPETDEQSVPNEPMDSEPAPDVITLSQRSPESTPPTDSRRLAEAPKEGNHGELLGNAMQQSELDTPVSESSGQTCNILTSTNNDNPTSNTSNDNDKPTSNDNDTGDSGSVTLTADSSDIPEQGQTLLSCNEIDENDSSTSTNQSVSLPQLTSSFENADDETDTSSHPMTDVVRKPPKKRRRCEFSCHLCNYVGRYESCLQSHYEAHKYTESMCKYCSKAFARRSDLLRHERRHEELEDILPEKPLNTVHDQSKTNKLYCCKECPYASTKFTNLYHHKRTKHHPAFRCPKCSSRFSSRMLHTKHMKSCQGSVLVRADEFRCDQLFRSCILKCKVSGNVITLEPPSRVVDADLISTVRIPPPSRLIDLHNIIKGSQDKTNSQKKNDLQLQKTTGQQRENETLPTRELMASSPLSSTIDDQEIITTESVTSTHTPVTPRSTNIGRSSEATITSQKPSIMLETIPSGKDSTHKATSTAEPATSIQGSTQICNNQAGVTSRIGTYLQKDNIVTGMTSPIRRSHQTDNVLTEMTLPITKLPQKDNVVTEMTLPIAKSHQKDNMVTEMPLPVTRLPQKDNVVTEMASLITRSHQKDNVVTEMTPPIGRRHQQDNVVTEMTLPIGGRHQEDNVVTEMTPPIGGRHQQDNVVTEMTPPIGRRHQQDNVVTEMTPPIGRRHQQDNVVTEMTPPIGRRHQQDNVVTEMTPPIGRRHQKDNVVTEMTPPIGRRHQQDNVITEMTPPIGRRHQKDNVVTEMTLPIGGRHQKDNVVTEMTLPIGRRHQKDNVITEMTPPIGRRHQKDNVVTEMTLPIGGRHQKDNVVTEMTLPIGRRHQKDNVVTEMTPPIGRRHQQDNVVTEMTPPIGGRHQKDNVVTKMVSPVRIMIDNLVDKMIPLMRSSAQKDNLLTEKTTFIRSSGQNNNVVTEMTPLIRSSSKNDNLVTEIVADHPEKGSSLNVEEFTGRNKTLDQKTDVEMVLGVSNSPQSGRPVSASNDSIDDTVRSGCSTPDDMREIVADHTEKGSSLKMKEFTGRNIDSETRCPPTSLVRDMSILPTNGIAAYLTKSYLSFSHLMIKDAPTHSSQSLKETIHPQHEDASHAITSAEIPIDETQHQNNIDSSTTFVAQPDDDVADNADVVVAPSSCGTISQSVNSRCPEPPSDLGPNVALTQAQPPSDLGPNAALTQSVSSRCLEPPSDLGPNAALTQSVSSRGPPEPPEPPTDLGPNAALTPALWRRLNSNAHGPYRAYPELIPNLYTADPLPKLYKERLDYCCERCNYHTNTEAKFEEHMQAHHGRYICKFCNRACIKSSDLFRHWVIHNVRAANREYACDTCFYTTSEKAVMSEHLKVHYNSRPTLPEVHNMTRCEVCGKAVTHAQLPGHVKRFHPRPNTMMNGDSSVDDNGNVASPGFVINEQGMYSCPSCKADFLKADELVQHHKAVHLNTPPRANPSVGSVKKHWSPYKSPLPHPTKATHTSPQCSRVNRPHFKGYSCSLCDRVFFKKSSLHMHEVSHRQYSTLESAKLDEISKSLSAPYRGARRRHCPVCSKKFKSLLYMKRHLLLDHQCNKSGISFSHSQPLDQPQGEHGSMPQPPQHILLNTSEEPMDKSDTPGCCHSGANTDTPGCCHSGTNTDTPGCCHSDASTDTPGCSHSGTNTDTPGCSHSDASTDTPGCSHSGTNADMPGCSHSDASTDTPGCCHSGTNTDTPGCSHSDASTDTPGCSHSGTNTDTPGCCHSGANTDTPGCCHSGKNTDMPVCCHSGSSTDIPACCHSDESTKKPGYYHSDASTTEVKGDTSIGGATSPMPLVPAKDSVLSSGSEKIMTDIEIVLEDHRYVKRIGNDDIPYWVSRETTDQDEDQLADNNCVTSTRV